MNHGKLCLTVDVPSSPHLGALLTVDVRNAELTLVKKARSGDELDLAPGLYQVSSVLEDGHRHSKVVEVSEGKWQVAHLSTPEPERAKRSGPGRPPPPCVTVLPFVDGEVGLDVRPIVPPWRNHGWLAIAIEGARMSWTRDNDVVFDPVGKPTGVPYVYLKNGQRTRAISLPVNPSGYAEEEQQCILRFDEYANTYEPRAVISPARGVPRAIQEMMATGHVYHAQAIASQALDLLLHKYRDAVGATLGALVMYDAGTLSERLDWLENLVRDFAWMPDAKILRAALHFEMGECADALRLLTEASMKRPMFTLSFSIMVNLLRRWRGGSESHAVSEALNAVTQLSGKMDWRAFTFTVRHGDGP